MGKILTFLSRGEMTKVSFQGKWYKANGGNYNKINFLIEKIFGSPKRKYNIESFSFNGWNCETMDIEVSLKDKGFPPRKELLLREILSTEDMLGVIAIKIVDKEEEYSLYSDYQETKNQLADLNKIYDELYL